ncbi:MAG: hypothetical protein M3Q69_02500 [Acidobacteriota bacterium]|nr:hypothetical protein [Acidobacteriota bacterium]
MPPYLKQYGERRTGTNALRALVAANYDDVIVLMHILGDKHSPPVDLDALWAAVQGCSDPAWELVSRSTAAARSLTTRSADHWQLVEMRRHAAPFGRAFVEGAFGYLVSIKNPYAWAVSLARFTRWPRAVALTRMREACGVFNARYHAWLPLLESQRRPALLVRHEDLIGDAEAVLERADRTFGTSRSTTFHAITGVARPAPWDHDPLPVSPQPFDAGPYLRHEYLHALTAEQQEVVTSAIDWDLMARFGYTRNDA